MALSKAAIVGAVICVIIAIICSYLIQQNMSNQEHEKWMVEKKLQAEREKREHEKDTIESDRNWQREQHEMEMHAKELAIAESSIAAAHNACQRLIGNDAAGYGIEIKGFLKLDLPPLFSNNKQTIEDCGRMFREAIGSMPERLAISYKTDGDKITVEHGLIEQI